MKTSETVVILGGMLALAVGGYYLFFRKSSGGSGSGSGGGGGLFLSGAPPGQGTQSTTNLIGNGDLTPPTNNTGSGAANVGGATQGLPPYQGGYSGQAGGSGGVTPLVLPPVGGGAPFGGFSAPTSGGNQGANIISNFLGTYYGAGNPSQSAITPGSGYTAPVNLIRAINQVGNPTQTATGAPVSSQVAIQNFGKAGVQ